MNGCFHPGLISIAPHALSVQVQSEPEETNSTLPYFMLDVLYKKSGLYAFLNELDEVVYIGKSINLLDRIPSSYRERCRYSNISKIMYYVDDNIANVNILELLLISEYEPVLNTDCKTEHKSTLFSSGIDIKTDFVELEEFVFAEGEV